MNSKANSFNNPITQLMLLEERVRLSGSTLPRVVDTREQWTGVRSTIDGLRCVLHLDQVSEVLNNRRITSIPGCVPWVRGALNLRGRLLPVFTMAEYFALPDMHGPRTASPQIVVVEKPGVFCGILVEKVFGMQKFYEEDFGPAEQAKGRERLGRVAEFVTAVTDIDEQQWYRLDLAALAAELGKADPAQKLTVHSTTEETAA